MTATARSLHIYEELATWYDHQGQAKLRDWFLVLAADTALALGQAGLAERLRQRLLHVNPHHLLRPFASFAEALQSPDVQSYIADLRRNYPLETAEQLLQATQKKSATAPPPEERELKVYRAQKTPENPTPPAPRPSNPPPAPPPPIRREMPLPVAWTRPALPPPRPAPPPSEEDGSTEFSFWVSSLLWAVVLLVGIGLALYVFVRPFVAV